ncbi:MAG: aminotransferase class V-fold PLP-dependent enzyme [Bacteroidia bacterium]|nr:aminotransferase class V-fold PLP-dependent enzyme [Bacteroidia bacterium]
MKQDRRQFLLKAAAASAVLALRPFSSEAFSPNSIPSLPEFKDEEKYWKLVRDQFPLDKTKTFLNNGTMGPSPYPVINEVTQEMLHVDTIAKYGGYEEETVAAISNFLGCEKEEMSITRNVTEGINIVCWGVKLNKGDEVIITTHEHVGNAGPWLNKSVVQGIILKPLSPGKDAQETFEIIKKSITSKTKMISIPHVPCTTGQVYPVKEICAYARTKGIITMLDGAHPPGMLNVNLTDIGCDFYSGCCHKWMLGPKGTGFLYVNKESRKLIQPYYMGGGTDLGWDLLTTPVTFKGYVENGHRFYYGTQNAALLKGVIKAIEFHETIGKDNIEKRVKSLSGYFQKNLVAIDSNIEMMTPFEEISRGGQVGFKIKGKEMTALQKYLGERAITTRYVAENNLNNLRISTHIYNSFAEIDTLLGHIADYMKA